ncbi:hypothetical protein OIY81_1459 [Cryptosporidium canis]|uniref:Importin N-terminal domain-containing protein n=1 Tax=Cryptosporidium canis TaxID=195482 RepID=A0ABQ8P831_9CRYT|nr:hypothetical protein OJ252_1452 [Cryptosporidium canis]KAJ1612112.1 hypothetical protein OIY81_1459 [Cryptosporidium canis]
MSYTRELVHLRIQELWTSSDSLKRAEANRYLLEFKDSFQAWQICSELLDLNVEPEVKYIAAQTLCQKISSNLKEVQSIGGPRVIFDQIYLRTISKCLEAGNGGGSVSQLLSKLGEGLSYLIILGISDGSWMEGFDSCLMISKPFFVGKSTGLELWIILNVFRYIPDAGALLESQKKPILIQSTLPRVLDFLSESITKILSDSSIETGDRRELNQKLLELSLDILVEYFEKFEIPLFTHSPLSQAISNLLKSDVNIAPYKLAELFVRGLPRCSLYMQKQGFVGEHNSIITLAENANELQVLLKFPSEAETTIMMSLLNYLKLLYDKLRQIPLPNYSNNERQGSQAANGQDGSQMIRINTWSTLKMNVPHIDLDEDTERSILSWSGVIFSLLEGYTTIFIIGELPEVKSRCSSQGKTLDNPLSFLPGMLSLLLMLHVKIPGVLVNIWCTLRDLVNEGIISKDQGLSVAGMLITPAIQSLATQCRTDFFYWEKLGINENTIMNARISTYSNFGLKELSLDESVEEFLDFLETATLHINDIYFFLLSLGTAHGQGFITYIQHSLVSCSNENDPIGCVVFLRFSDTLIEATNSLQGTISSILELSCSTIPQTQSCIYQITLLLQKSAHLLVDQEYAPIWLLSLQYLIQISQKSSLLLISSTFEELCQFGADHVANHPHYDQILLDLCQSVTRVVTSKLQFSNDSNLYGNISIIDENIGFVGGFVHILCYTMIKNQKSTQNLAQALKHFLYDMIHPTIEQIPQVYNNTSFSDHLEIGILPQCYWIWSTYVFLKILQSFTFCLENSPKNNHGGEIRPGLEVSSNLPIHLSMLIEDLFSAQNQSMFILGNQLKSLLFNSFNLYSESQGFGVVLISSMMHPLTRNISLHNLMVCTRRSFTGQESSLSCPRDVIVSICHLILRIISCTWSVNSSHPEGQNSEIHRQGITWCTWEYTYSNIKQSLLHLKSELDGIGHDERALTLAVRQRHGCSTMLLQEVIKRLSIEERDQLVSMMHNDGLISSLYEFWIKKFYSINNLEISRSMEPFFLWQISLLSYHQSSSISVQILLSCPYLVPTLEITRRCFEFNDKYLLNSVLIYLTRLSRAISTCPQIHEIWSEQLGRILIVLFSVYSKFDKNSLLQMSKLVSLVLEYFPSVFFMILNEMFSPEFSRVHPEIRANPFQDTNQQQQSVILASFKSIKGVSKLRQLLLEISNVANGISSMDECIGKFQILLSSNNVISVGDNGNNPIVIT